MVYDIAIIGTGVAGLSAAINAKVRKKNIIIFGSNKLSDKLVKAHQVNNYLGMYGMTGQQMAEAFSSHIQAMGIDITEDRITNVVKMKDHFSMLSKANNMYEAKAVILACGVSFTKQIDGEREFLGSGVSYCATCDAFAYNNKTTVVIGYDKEQENEAEFLTHTASKVYYIPMYKLESKLSEKIEIVNGTPACINKEDDKMVVTFKNSEQENIVADGVFVLRDSVSTDQLINGIAIKDNHIVTDRLMNTSIQGCFAAGDIVGKPYQYIKAAGEGNVAALSAAAYLDNLTN